MIAGRELDALVADKVMGFKIEKGSGGEPIIITSQKPRHEADLPEYSTDIASAWVVVEYLRRERDWPFCMGVESPSVDQHFAGWDAEFDSHNEFFSSNTVTGETAPHAICLAALKAVNAPHR